mgnify:CR=1 FL=1
MKIEVMIYVYLAICVGMIAFNIINAVLSRSRDKKMLRVSHGFHEHITCEFQYLEENGDIHDSHKKYLSKKLKRIGNMRAFDKALEGEYSNNPTLVQNYLYCLSSVFVSLTISYCNKDDMEASYFPYIIKKYKILEERPFDVMLDMLYALLHKPSIYCRENAMQAIYTIGDPSCVIKALKIIDNPNQFYHNKLLTDGLLNFNGAPEKLHAALWEAFEDFSCEMQVTLLNYFRFSSGDHCERILELMIDESRDDEIRFSCIRYFGKYRFDKAYPYLLVYADCKSEARWEYSAIAFLALSIYPFPETTALLKSNLYHRNWYIRYNASLGLEKMGLTYLDLIDVIEGNDRYASEILRYRFDVRGIREEEKEAGA